ncbi:phenylacetic acid degradation protein PaaN [Ornithinimicrobium ciconiae]|uniref:Phenylacetic acid degradation protein PaaN n=1 Tax=Ornithinimicrobium ciconiae TaxID=2594265 RepID=A0A516G701_9MICO|nr:phenylacetic acid degradation protein PaaN [Ornithinimicrobium ciconiae]QDO87299.1 phenylacetic acid degradation protein PaaN [Ornithinimicrobium ciconiae]
MTETAPGAALLESHGEVLDTASNALATREYYSRYPESPSPRVYGENAAQDGRSAFEQSRNSAYSPLSDQPSTGTEVGSEVSPYGPALGVRYPELDIEAGVEAARAAMPAWRDAGARIRAAVCVEIIEQINARSHEIANAVMHTSGQPFVMSFQAGGPHAQDRALEAVTAALVEQERVPASVTWEKPTKGDPIRMQKDYRVVPRGLALVIGCNTFPTWNAYPGLFASLATGNPVIVKPHPQAVLPLAITVSIARDVLAKAGFDKALVQLAAEGEPVEGRDGLAKILALHPAVRIIDYTGGPGFGGWLEREAAAEGKLVYTEKAGLNTVVVDSTDNLKGVLGNLAFSFSLYSGQMCTAPQNVYVPADGISTDEGELTYEQFGEKLAGAISAFNADDARAVEILGATVNPDVRERATDVPGLAQRLGGEVILDARPITHPSYPDAVVVVPALIGVDAANLPAYSQECFGPVAFLIRTESTDASLDLLRSTVQEHGAMTASVYSTDEEVLEDAREAAADAGVALSENLTGQIFVNQTAAFSDFHGTGANPAANAAYSDAAFVANRFRIITSRRHV